ncbi:(d)CMP kinase [Candidatus Collierbacteria bacterium]|nr:(d)CMP kinase [Candidatus Collierbacteria bacterium]
MQIAIDGPIAAGKGTIAKQVAEKLGFLYVDTGAMYRAISVLCDWDRVNKTDEAAVCSLIEKLTPKLELRPPTENEQDGRLCTVILEGKDVSWEIRSEESSRGSSLVSKYLCVRDYLTEIQRLLAKNQNVVMEGRDIGTFVIPDAQLKIFLTAAPEIRAKRRRQELIARGLNPIFNQVLKELIDRDNQDITRPLRPLKKAAGAVAIDTSDMTIAEVVDKIVRLAKERLKYGWPKR